MKNHLNFHYAPTFIVDVPNALRRLNRSLRFFVMHRVHYEHSTVYNFRVRLHVCNAPDALQWI